MAAKLFGHLPSVKDTGFSRFFPGTEETNNRKEQDYGII
jgi:hypothetical protein